MEFTDFQGRVVKAGDVIAVAMTRGRSSASLFIRFVRCVHDNHIEVQSTPDEPEDKRGIGRLSPHTDFIIIS